MGYMNKGSHLLASYQCTEFQLVTRPGLRHGEPWSFTATRQWKIPQDLGESPPPAVLPGYGGKAGQGEQR